MTIIVASKQQSSPKQKRDPWTLKLYDVENFPLKVNRLRTIADVEMWRPIESKVMRLARDGHLLSDFAIKFQLDI